MARPFARILASCILLFLLGCDHSPSMGSIPDRPVGTFAPGPYSRLTFNSGDDIFPAISSPGLLSYQFRRGTLDTDLCAGILPTEGGERRAQVCAWEPDDDRYADSFGAAVLLDQNRLLWTRHRSRVGVWTAQEAGLYLGSADDPRSAKQILQLLVHPLNGTARWDALVDPVQTGPNEITALAAQWYVGRHTRLGVVDTVILGVEIVKIDVSTTPATISRIGPAPDAIGWAVDPTAKEYYYLRPSYAPPTEESVYRVIADSVFRVGPLGGTAIWGRRQSPTETAGGTEGIAVGGGRVLVSVWQSEPVPVPPPGVPPIHTTTRILALFNATDPIPIAERISTDGTHWGRLASDSAGRVLIVESIEGLKRDLYRVEVP